MKNTYKSREDFEKELEELKHSLRLKQVERHSTYLLLFMVVCFFTVAFGLFTYGLNLEITDRLFHFSYTGNVIFLVYLVVQLYRTNKDPFEIKKKKSLKPKPTKEELEKAEQEAIEKEDYERARKIRNNINRLN